jgi:hypothetical protein
MQVLASQSPDQAGRIGAVQGSPQEGRRPASPDSDPLWSLARDFELHTRPSGRTELDARVYEFLRASREAQEAVEATLDNITTQLTRPVVDNVETTNAVSDAESKHSTNYETHF